MNCFTFPSRKAIVIQRNAYDLLGSCVVFFSISPTKHEIMVWTKAISTSPQRLLNRIGFFSKQLVLGLILNSTHILWRFLCEYSSIPIFMIENLKLF
jgi:hypothetical protein